MKKYYNWKDLSVKQIETTALMGISNWLMTAPCNIEIQDFCEGQEYTEGSCNLDDMGIEVLVSFKDTECIAEPIEGIAVLNFEYESGELYFATLLESKDSNKNKINQLNK